MAKGQQRGTREKKKPKQEKVKSIATTSRFGAMPSTPSNATAGKKK